MAKAEEIKTFSEAVGGTQFYPDLPKKPLSECLDKQYLVVDATIVYGFESKFGESDFALLLLQDMKDGSQFTTLCGGMVVVKKIAKALQDDILPLYGTITKQARYYDII